jgi:NLR family CARD domain-containing protein 3
MFRQEPIPKFVKPSEMCKQVKVRKFHKALSVWKDWKDDTEAIHRKCLIHDFRHWKIPRFIKDPNEQKAIEEVVTENFHLLKSEHLYLASCSIFPGTSLNQFTSYSKRARFQDKNINQSALDTMFIAVNFDIGDDDGGDNPEGALIRYEFIELLVRLARDKFFKPGTSETVAEGLQMLINRHIKPIAMTHEW